MFKQLTNIRRRIAQHLINRRGWSTGRKIVVIESDDWGSIRMPSGDAYSALQKQGVPVEKSPYCRYDSLASEKDLELLFSTLRSYRDSAGNHPVITANCVVSNPDFEKIEEAEFAGYFCEPISVTFQRYPEHQNCLEIWKQGNRERLFHPQSHGKEHLNSSHWLNLLRNGDADFRLAFENRCWGLSSDLYPEMKRSVQASFDMEDLGDLDAQAVAIREGLRLFEEIFGYRSRSFIANNYIWSEELNRVLAECGVRYLQGMKYQKLPIYEGSKRKMIRHFVGEKNRHGQYYLVRNCTFEPSIQPADFDSVKDCMKGIATAFAWERPAIICSHRINYVGFLDEANRERGLEMLGNLLSSIITRWPEVEFMTSDQLGEVIEGGVSVEENSPVVV